MICLKASVKLGVWNNWINQVYFKTEYFSLIFVSFLIKNAFRQSTLLHLNNMLGSVKQVKANASNNVHVIEKLNSSYTSTICTEAKILSKIFLLQIIPEPFHPVLIVWKNFFASQLFTETIVTTVGKSIKRKNLSKGTNFISYGEAKVK